MNKKLKYLSKSIKESFDINAINKISKYTKFIQRKGSITAKDFMMFNVFYGSDICSAHLSQLVSKYDMLFSKQLSKQALDKRFNKHSVEFMKEIFVRLLYAQNSTLTSLERTLRTYFDRVIINDSTSFVLPKEFKKKFPGSGGSGSPSSIKVQLQYDLLTGSFMNVDIFSGIKTDVEYLKTMKKYKNNKDLKLADLGYFKIDYLKRIDKSGTSFISKVKSNTSLYVKNPNPEKYKVGTIKKSSEYIKIDIIKLVEPLAPGETIELNDIYIGSKKDFQSRLIITKLTKENKEKRVFNHIEGIRKKRLTLSQRRLDFNSVNAYITNVPSDIIVANQVHELYSLRWQIEIIFKVWKSIFKINQVKLERFMCFLYGRLIALLLSSTIVFTSKSIILEEDKKEISELKAFGNLTQYFPKLSFEIFKGEFYISRILKSILNNFRRLGIKSKKNHKKTALDILKLIKLNSFEVVKFAI
ncbi:IS4 family transposase [Clostridium perfringens]|uniref:IS4 family transposase n=1 Tax=Clostridium perfringens TaxID=1502 RepID=UPI003BAD117D